MTTITAFLSADHRHCDELFAAPAQAAEHGNWAACRERFEAFQQALKHHMAIEEQVLFPAFEQATGINEGPTQVMRHEHQEMLALLDRVSVAITAGSAARFRSSAESFTALMTLHGTKEEDVLYPVCDEVLSSLSGERLSELVRQHQLGLHNGASDEPAIHATG